MRLRTSYVALSLSIFIPDVAAFWRLPCSSAVVTERSDPVVSPGMVAAHAHAVMGANNFNYTATFADLRASDCTTCQVSQDKSVYWVPSLYFHDTIKNTFESVTQVGGMLAYYIQRYGYNGEQLYAFPDGFRMLAGNSAARSSYGTLESRAISYHCLDYNNPSIPETGGFPTVACPNGLRQQIFFPSCWDGVNIDSPDHKAHVAYPSNSDSGTCPSTHPYRLISLFYEVIWWTIPYAGRTGKFVLSNGDPTGFGSHADFINGWDHNVLQAAVDTCTNDSGVFTDCPLFDVIPQATAAQCKKTPSLPEQIFGTMKALPGNNPVQYGSGNANMYAYDATIPSSAVVKKSLGVSDASTRKASQFPQPISISAKGCFADGYPLSRSMPGLGVYGIYQTNSMTNQLCSQYCLSQGFAFSGTEYSTQCFCSNALPKKSSSACAMPCGGDSTQVCGGDNALSVFYNSAGAKFVTDGSNTAIKATTTTQAPPASAATGYTTSGLCNGSPFQSGIYVCWGNRQLCPIVNGIIFGACAGSCFDPALYSCINGFLRPGGSLATVTTTRSAIATKAGTGRVPLKTITTKRGALVTLTRRNVGPTLVS